MYSLIYEGTTNYLLCIACHVAYSTRDHISACLLRGFFFLFSFERFFLVRKLKFGEQILLHGANMKYKSHSALIVYAKTSHSSLMHQNELQMIQNSCYNKSWFAFFIEVFVDLTQMMDSLFSTCSM
jgi:hypothetical protein